MGQIKGKQIKDGSISDAKVDSSIIVADGSNDFTGEQSMGTNKLTNLVAGTASTDAVNKAQLDAVSSGVSWKEPAAVNGYIGNRTVAEINSLGTPSAGTTVVATDGAPTAPSEGTSDALEAGDLAEFNGNEWKIILANSGGFVPSGTRAVISTVETLVAPLAGSTDEGKVATWDGAALAPDATLTLVDGDAILVNGEGSVNENKGYTFDGVVPTGAWIQFTGLGLVDAGDGLIKTGNTLDVVGGDGITANSNDIALDLQTSGGLKIDTAQLAVEPDDFAGDGLEDDGSDNLRAVADGDTITVGAGGIKSITAQTADKELVPAVTSGDDFDTLLGITTTPVGARYIQVFVNGLKVTIGDGVTGKDCYFSSDGGASGVRALSAIVAGDDFIWNGALAGYQLDATDDVDFDYEIAA